MLIPLFTRSGYIRIYSVYIYLCVYMRTFHSIIPLVILFIVPAHHFPNRNKTNPCLCIKFWIPDIVGA